MLNQIILLISFSIFSLLGFYQIDFTDQTAKIELDINQVFLPCPAGYFPPGGKECQEGMTITVKTSLDNKVTESIIYNYEVSGGKIIGQGENVVWDLSGLSPGTYKISAIIENKVGKILGKTKVETITIENCNCGGDCFCSTFKIISPDSPVKRGDKIIFITNPEGNSENLKITWTVSGGEIIYEGYKNTMIRVKVSSDKTASEVKVTVKLTDYDTCMICNDEESATVKIVDN